MSTGFAGRLCAVATLLSFERPHGGVPPLRASADLENCIRQRWVIDGSSASAPELLTVKMSRAHGECLGTRRRRRTWTAAISRGEALNSL
jgi:hypothetical protein